MAEGTLPSVTRDGKMTDGNCVDTCCRSVICTEGDGGGATQAFSANSQESRLSFWQGIADGRGRKAVSPGRARRRAGEHPDGHHAMRCPAPQRSAPWAPRPGVHGRRKDCLVTTPEAEPRKEARAPVRFSDAGGSHGHRPHHRYDRGWLP